jgi:hypothetical protein
MTTWILEYLGDRWVFSKFKKEAGGVVTSLFPSLLILYSIGQSINGIFLIVFGLVSLTFMALVIFGVTWVALSIATYLVRRRNPDALLASGLFRAMMLLERQAEKWPDPEFRAGVAKNIAEASRLARSFLFRRFDVSDPATRLWQIRQANCIADTLAQKQRWLITPKPDTHHVLLQTLSCSVVAALSGTWDEFVRTDHLAAVNAEDRTEGGAVTRGRRAISTILAVLRSLSVAALPVVAFWAARWRGLLTTVDPRAFDYVEIGVFVWAVLILAFVLDPQLKERISTFKEVATLNPFKGNK